MRSIPGPFAIAAGLTILTMVLALFLTLPEKENHLTYSAEILSFWYGGFWDLLAFAMQMMLILVLGHVLAYTRPVRKVINLILRLCTNNARAALFITLFTVLAALVNWGLGLIFGAIMARKVAEYGAEHGIPINYPLMGAAGYSGLMVWHAGLSGSAPLTIASPGHFLEAEIGVIPVTETLFSTMNLTVIAALLITLPLLMYYIARRIPGTVPEITKDREEEESPKSGYSKYALFFGILLLSAGAGEGIRMGMDAETSFWEILSLNYINYMLFGLCLLFWGSFSAFSKATGEAIVSGTGIFLQFPLYAGIMGIMADSGLLALVSDFFVRISGPETFPVFTFFSGGLVNVFVPSGGGQWAVQGPLIVEASKHLGLDIQQSVMALSYGDQITNMIQPFWALPLLGITGLRAASLLPYTLVLMAAGMVIYIGALLLF